MQLTHLAHPVFLLSLLTLSRGVIAAQDAAPTRIQVGGVELHYVTQGKGEPLIFLHGGQGDYRMWTAHMAAMAPCFRTVAYSRRYHYPNDNPIADNNHSALIDAEDLAALIATLELGRVHLVGTSYGALTALALAVQRPEMVRSLVLAEPPLHAWMDGTPGERMNRQFLEEVMKPAGADFAAGDDHAAMRRLVDWFAGEEGFDRMQPAAVAAVMQNARFFRAVTQAAAPFPNLPKETVARLPMPILVIEGEHTIVLHRQINAELRSVQPRAKLAVIPSAGHASPRENPEGFLAAVRAFLRENGLCPSGPECAAC